MQQYVADSIESLKSTALRILQNNPEVKIFALQGDLGAGKTAAVKAFVLALGIQDEVSSPTFSLVNEYGNKPLVYHFDLYRLSSTEEILQIGFEEYVDSGHYCFIEWPEKITHLLPSKQSKLISIVVDVNQIRHIKVTDF